MNLESSILLKRIITINGCRDNCYLNVKDGVIHSITEKKIFDNEIVDFSNLTAVPGFIDIHTHGYFGVDATYSSEEEIHRWAQMLARKGITNIIFSQSGESSDAISNLKLSRKYGFTVIGITNEKESQLKN